MKKSYVMLIGLLIVGLIVIISLYRKPIEKEESAIDKQEPSVVQEVTSEVVNDEPPPPVVQDIVNDEEMYDEEAYMAKFKKELEIDKQASRLIRGIEVFAKIEEAHRRYRRPPRPFTEDEMAQIRREGGVLQNIMGLIREAAMDGGKRDLLPVFERLVDYRDGELRPPPNTREFWVLQGKLYGLVHQPKLTDEDKDRVRELVGEIHEMAKTNTPAVTLQMPEEEE